MTWISFFTTSYQRQPDGHTDRQTQWKVSAVICPETKHHLFWVKHFSPTEVFPLLCSNRPKLTSLTIRSKNVWEITFSYLFFKTPGFDNLRCQSETWRVFNALVHLTKTTPNWWERDGERNWDYSTPVSSHTTSWKHAWECRTQRFMFQWQIKKWSLFQLRRFTVLCVLNAVFH